jgi:hypothetical protein
MGRQRMAEIKRRRAYTRASAWLNRARERRRVSLVSAFYHLLYPPQTQRVFTSFPPLLFQQ